MSGDFRIQRPARRLVLAEDLEPVMRLLETISGGSGIRVLKTGRGILITTGGEVAFDESAGGGASSGFPPGFEPLDVLLNIDGEAVEKTIMVRDPDWTPPTPE